MSVAEALVRDLAGPQITKSAAERVELPVKKEEGESHCIDLSLVGRPVSPCPIGKVPSAQCVDWILVASLPCRIEPLTEINQANAHRNNKAAVELSESEHAPDTASEIPINYICINYICQSLSREIRRKRSEGLDIPPTRSYLLSPSTGNTAPRRYCR